MVEAVQEAGKNIRRSIRVAYEETVPGGGGTENVVWSGCLSRQHSTNWRPFREVQH